MKRSTNPICLQNGAASAGRARLYAAVMLLGSAASLGACGPDAKAGASGGERDKGDKQEATAKVAVQLVQARKQPMARLIVVSGSLAADEKVTLSAKVPGRLASIAIDLGSPVVRNQPIAQIELSDYQLRVDQATSALSQARALLGLSPDGADETIDVEQANAVKSANATLDEARSNLERARQLVEQKLIARSDFDAANAAFLRAQTNLDDAREQIRNRQAMLRQRRSELMLAQKQREDTTIRAPLDGLVQERLVSAGEYLAVGAPIATLVRVDPLRLRVDLPERDAANVRVGQVVRVKVDESGTSYEGQVARMAPSISEQNRTLTIEAEIKNPGTLRPGSFVRAEIVGDGQGSVLAVPTSSIVTFAGIEKVISVEEGKAVEMPVTTGLRTPELTEITSELPEGTWVVLAPGNLQEGQAVEVTRTP